MIKKYFKTLFVEYKKEFIKFLIGSIAGVLALSLIVSFLRFTVFAEDDVTFSFFPWLFLVIKIFFSIEIIVLLITISIQFLEPTSLLNKKEEN